MPDNNRSRLEFFSPTRDYQAEQRQKATQAAQTFRRGGFASRFFFTPSARKHRREVLETRALEPFARAQEFEGMFPRPDDELDDFGFGEEAMEAEIGALGTDIQQFKEKAISAADKDLQRRGLFESSVGEERRSDIEEAAIRQLTAGESAIMGRYAQIRTQLVMQKRSQAHAAWQAARDRGITIMQLEQARDKANAARNSGLARALGAIIGAAIGFQAGGPQGALGGARIGASIFGGSGLGQPGGA